MIVSIDPGTEKSAILVLKDGKINEAHLLPNEDLLKMLRSRCKWEWTIGELAVEMIASYGMPVGRETFETCVLIGRIQEIAHSGLVQTRFVYRKDIKVHLCGTTKAKDANVRQALIDKYGPQGTKKNPGPTYGMKADLWAALAIADYAINNRT